LANKSLSQKWCNIGNKIAIDHKQEVAYVLFIGAKINDRDDHKWPLFSLFQKCVFFASHHENLNEDRPTLLAAKM